MASTQERSDQRERVCLTLALIVFGILHFLHPTGLPGVPLQKQMPGWLPGCVLIDYVTGALLLIAAGSVLLRRKTREVAASVGGWILLMVVVIYILSMISALGTPDIESEGGENQLPCRQAAVRRSGPLWPARRHSPRKKYRPSGPSWR